ncbi:MAG: deoxyguanosinetriphosphate triphosphohydrolase [Hyphomicrobiaceae bacterium]
MAASRNPTPRDPEAHFDYGAKLPRGHRALAPYAASRLQGRGRLHAEPECPTRSAFQRDRDRIVHASAFRRLTYKTQMFVFHEGDNFRTRLTHTLEVTQIARTIARQLCLDEDLAEAIALSHDLGHPPFGHAGERALDAKLADCGGFDHNVQSFRIVTYLERKYADFDGLNLTWETLEGLAKHNGPPASGGHPGDATLMRALRGFQALMDLEFDCQPSAEAQVAALADDIAWRTHDIDDGLRAGLISMEDLRPVPLIAPILERVAARATRERARDIYEVVRQLITLMVNDVVGESRRRLANIEPANATDIRQAREPVIGFSAALAPDLEILKRFLFAKLYRHAKVMAVMDDACLVVGDLVDRYRAHPHEMLERWARGAQVERCERNRLRIVGDFVAGMTDRFALSEHRRLFDATPELR